MQQQPKMFETNCTKSFLKKIAINDMAQVSFVVRVYRV